MTGFGTPSPSPIASSNNPLGSPLNSVSSIDPSFGQPTTDELLKLALARALQPTSPWATALMGASLPASEVLQAELTPHFAGMAPATKASTTAPGPLPFQGSEQTPTSAMTTSAILAQLL
jgi:hypothetical protein